MRARDRIVVNPENIGADGIPVLGLNRARNMSAGAELHRHKAMEITVCEHGAVKFDADGHDADGVADAAFPLDRSSS